MYETCFNLTERPFASVPRIDHYYPGAVIDAARNTLIRCVNRGEGVALIIGPSGTGKSLLCRSWRSSSRRRSRWHCWRVRISIRGVRSCRRSSTS